MARPPLHPLIERLGAYSWCLVGIGIVIWVSLQGLGALRVVVFPLVVAVFLSAVLNPPAGWLRRHGRPPLAAAWVVFAAFLGILGCSPRGREGFFNLIRLSTG